MKKYIQSFYQYPVTFPSIGKTIPAREADGELRNIAEFEEEEVEKLQNQEPFFRELLDQKKIRILNHLPESYRPAAVLVNEANDRAAKAEAELAALKAEMAQKEAESNERGPAPEAAAVPAEEEPTMDDVPLDKWDYKALQDFAKAHGVENVNIKKAELVKACKAITSPDK